MTRRRLAWAKALSDLRADRDTPQAIREVPLRVRGLGQPVSLTLSAWRGRSGRRYVVSVHPFCAREITRLGRDTVILAVQRLESYPATIVGVHIMTPHHPDLALDRMLLQAVASAATEFHIYRLAETSNEKAAFAKDLCRN